MFPICQPQAYAAGDLLSTPRLARVYPIWSQPVSRFPRMIDTRLKALAKRIEGLVLASPYTPAELSRLLDVDRSAVSRWMNGERTPTMKNLYDLAELLNIEMADLWAGEHATPATPEQKVMMDRMGTMTLEQQQALLALAAATMGLTPPAKG